MGAAFAILAAASAVDRIDSMTTLARALEVDTPLLVLLTSSSCADCRFLAMGFGEAASLTKVVGEVGHRGHYGERGAGRR